MAEWTRLDPDDDTTYPEEGARCRVQTVAGELLVASLEYGGEWEVWSGSEWSGRQLLLTLVKRWRYLFEHELRGGGE